jgi:hypothetical protein
MQTIIDDIQELRTNRAGETHGYFSINGEPTEDNFCIDVINICKALAPFEIDYEHADRLPETENNGLWVDNDFAKQYIDYLIESDYIQDWNNAKYNNTYNWNSPVSNNIDYAVFKSLIDKSVYVLFKVHRWGDVRGNYTDSCILHFDGEYEWYEVFNETNRTEYIEIDDVKYAVDINFWRDGFEVYNTETWDYICTVYGCDREDVINDLKDKLKEQEQE